MRTSASKLRHHVGYLAGLDPARNYLNLGSLNAARDYISDAFRSYGFTPKLQRWEATGNAYYNVIARYNPDRPRTLVVGAHYDVAGSQPGADDNASAIAGLLETARLLSEEQPALDYAVELVAYSLEEPPFFAGEEMGSYIHARSLHSRGTHVLGMICYEMIGYFSDEPGSQQLPHPSMKATYGDKGDFIAVVSNVENTLFATKVFRLMKKADTVKTKLAALPNAEGLVGLSDHRNYWAFGYKAVMINDTSFLRNPHFHEPTDTPDTLDYNRMAGVVDASYAAIINM